MYTVAKWMLNSSIFFFSDHKEDSPKDLSRNLWGTLESTFSQPFRRLADDWYTMDGRSLLTHMVALDVKETPTQYEIVAELPGVRREELEIGIRDHVLTIKAERRKEDLQEGEHFHREERLRGVLSRSLVLPDDTNETSIKAEYKDGVLRITIPKSDKPKPAMTKINIE